MKVKELKRLLGYFSDDVSVCIQDKKGQLVHIDNARGEVDDTGTFYVRLDINQEVVV